MSGSAVSDTSAQLGSRKIGPYSFNSRLIVGTGKYRDTAQTEAALVASGAEIVTVALRRVNLNDRGEGSLMALLASKRWTISLNE